MWAMILSLQKFFLFFKPSGVYSGCPQEAPGFFWREFKLQSWIDGIIIEAESYSNVLTDG